MSVKNKNKGDRIIFILEKAMLDIQIELNKNPNVSKNNKFVSILKDTIKDVHKKSKNEKVFAILNKTIQNIRNLESDTPDNYRNKYLKYKRKYLKLCAE